MSGSVCLIGIWVLLSSHVKGVAINACAYVLTGITHKFKIRLAWLCYHMEGYVTAGAFQGQVGFVSHSAFSFLT